MHDNRNRRLEDAFGDAALDLILDEYAEESGAELLHEYEHAGWDAPVELDKLCTKQIHRAFRRKRLHAEAAQCLKVAVLTIVSLGLCLTMAMSVAAIRVPVLNFFLVRTARYTRISALPNNTVQSVSIYEELYAERESFAPDGYTLFREECSNAAFSAAYCNPAGDNAYVSVFNIHGNLQVDSEDCTETVLTVNGLEAIHWKKNQEPSQSVLLLVPEKEIVCHLYASNLAESDFWNFVYSFAAYL